MKLLFPIAIFFFLTISFNNARQCIDADEEINISEDFTLTAVQNAIKNLKLTDKYEECHVFIYIHYNDKEIGIESYTDLEESNLNTNHEVYFDTWIEIAQGTKIFEEGNIINVVQFACDYEDECDRRFILGHLEWLLKVNYTELASVIRQLAINHSVNTENQCFDYEQKKKQLCSSDMCSINYIMNSNSTSGNCVKKANMLTELQMESRIIIGPGNSMKEDEDSEIGDQIQERYFHIHYWCRRNNCNNPANAESLVKAVKEHYDLSTLSEVFKVNITETTTATPTDNSAGSTTTTTGNNADSKTTTSGNNAGSTTTTTDNNAGSTTTEKPNNTSTSLHIFINMMIFIDLLLIFHNFSF